MEFVAGSYRARVTRVIDGDTVDLVIDVGFHLNLAHRCRLAGINTPELHDKDPEVRHRAQAALQFASFWLSEVGEWPFRVETTKDPDNFGRWLARIYKGDHLREWCLNDALIAEGHASVFVKR